MSKERIFKLVLVFIIGFLTYQFGIKPFLSKDLLSSGNSNWAVKKLVSIPNQYHVIVVGEEPEGLAAALASARSGAKTLLIAEGENLGGVISNSMCADFEITLGQKGESLNKGIFSELNKKLGGVVSIDKYKLIADDTANAEKNLDIVYGARIESPVLEGNTITGVNVSFNGEKKTYKGSRFIDATRDGKLLLGCNVPYFTGSEDINVKDTFQPVRLNFEVDGVNLKVLSNVTNKDNAKYQLALLKYVPSDVNLRINDFKIVSQENNKVVIQGLEVANVNVTDNNEMHKAYQKAVNEAKEFTKFLKANFKEFKDSRFYKVADSFYVRETRHFIGEHVLSVNEELENRDFNDKIALGSQAIDAGKLTSNFEYIVGKPVQYSIPLGCIVPLKTDNLLMVGSKISYSSLASTSAGTISVNITAGQSAGVVAVYSLTENMTPREIAKTKDVSITTALEEILRKQGLYLPKISEKNSNETNWSYPAVKQLNALGLVAGGVNNDYRFETEAKQEELAILLLNGVYRLSSENYSLEFDGRLRKHFSKDKLTKEKAGEILLDMYGTAYQPGNAYEKACEMGYINNLMQLKLKDKKALTMDDVFYLGAYNIKNFTHKSIPE